jgi:hypothetical protein
LMAGRNQVLYDGRTDPAGRAGDKDAHDERSPRFLETGYRFPCYSSKVVRVS